MKSARILLATALTLAAGVIPAASPQPPLTVAVEHRFASALRVGRAPLVEAPDGTLFGTMENGGKGDNGAVFQLTPDGSGGFSFELLHVFEGIDGRKPVGLTYSAFDNKLYGTTEGGGVNGPIFDDMGTVFSLTRPTPGHPAVLTTLADLNSGGPIEQPLAPAAGLLEASDGNFYGAAAGASMSPNRGSIYKIDRAGIVEVLHLFTGNDGAFPGCVLVEGSDGFLYGTTAFGGVDDAGTVFKIGKDGTGFAMLHEFTGDPGTQPRGLLLDTSGGTDVFYGLTGGNGANSRGMVFRFTPTDPVTRLASFAAPNGEFPTGALVKGNNGLFYGTVEAGTPGVLGGVFSFDGHDISLVYDSNSDFSLGIQTSPGLLRAADGTLMGATFRGGDHRVGTVYRMDVADPLSPPFVSKVVDFPSLGPAFPQDRMIRASDGHLYGTTMLGGHFNSGTVFRFQNGVATTIHSFDFINGHIPSGELVQGTDGFLYGTTTYGGNVLFSGDLGGGLIYRISLAGAFSVVKVFSNYAAEGAQPLAGLVEGPDGNFYGTTHQNGPGGAGTIFKVTPSGVLTTLHSFSVWSATRGTLVIGADGYFYGVTREGGTNPLGGTIYKIDSAGSFVQLHEFTNFADGAHPNALILGTDGNFYGTTEHGGTNFGTLFRMTPGGTLTVLHRFNRAVDGEGPTAPPFEAGDGKLYGSTRFGGSSFGSFFLGAGTLYRHDAGGLAHLTTFGATGGPAIGDPIAGLTQGSDDHLYGSTQLPASGTIYSFDAGITNKAPAAASQRVSISAGGVANVTVAALDPDGDPFTYLVVDQPDNGTLSGSGPAFRYQPNPGFSGTDAFRVRVNDGTVSSPVATVLITVAAITVGTTTTLQVSPATAGALQPVTLTATVAATSGGGVPPGDVEFRIGTTVFGVAALQGGVAVLNTNASAIAGSFPITARYAGSATFTGSVSAPVTLTVRPLAESTYTYLIPWTTAQALGTPFTASALVLNIGSGPVPAGSVQFFDGASLVATQTLSGGVATATWTPAAAGTRLITARYVPSGTLAPSTSHPALVTVYAGAAPASTTTSLAGPASGTFGQPVTFTATLSNNVPAGGLVTFFVDGAQLGTALVTNAGGIKQATLTTSALPFGLRIGSASYGGAPGFAASNSALMTVLINP